MTLRLTCVAILSMAIGACSGTADSQIADAFISPDISYRDTTIPPSDFVPQQDSPRDVGPGQDLPLKPDGPMPDMPAPDVPQNCTAVVAIPSDEPWNTRAPSAGFGGIETKQNGPYTDVFLKSPTDYTRVGARLQWGGTVVFFGLSANSASNVIDANDTGRELQLALYDPTRAVQGCAYNASCGTGCDGGITYLGWNPVQGGDECGHGGKVLSHGQKGDALQLVVQPVQWNPDWMATDCVQSKCPAAGLPVDVTYTFELRYLTKHVVEVMSEVTSQETINHPVSGQEFPTLYVSHGKGGPDLPVLLDASGKAIDINIPANDGFFRKPFTSSAPWVSWQNSDSTYGVGLAMDQGITDFNGWRGTTPYFHNVRAKIAFALAAGATVRGLSYLVLGGFPTVKAEVAAVLAARPPFGWLDEPTQAQGTDVSYSPGDAIRVRGWVLDSTALGNVEVTIDGQPVKSISVGGKRTDVCARYPAYKGCPNVGFDAQVSTTGFGGPCPHLLRVTATDPNGNTTVLGERRMVPTS